MPTRIAVRSGRPAGPRPFSSEWLAADAPIDTGRRVPTAGLGSRWAHREHRHLIVVSIAAASAALLGGDRPMFTSPAPTQTRAGQRRFSRQSMQELSEPTRERPAPTAAATLAPDTSDHAK